MKRSADHPSQSAASQNYSGLVRDIGALLAAARRSSARAVNALMTATYWEVGRRIVEFEQRGEMRAAYGQELLKRLSRDLTARLGRGFSERNLEQMRLFYDGWPISQTPSAESNVLSTFQPVAGTRPCGRLLARSRCCGLHSAAAGAYANWIVKKGCPTKFSRANTS